MGPRKKGRWDKLWRRRRSVVEPAISFEFIVDSAYFVTLMLAI